jgi:hypothetical protein
MQQVSNQPRNRNRQQVSIPAIVVGTFVVLAVALWVIWHFVLHPAVTPKASAIVNMQPGKPGPLQMTSAQGGFSVVIPSGWGQVSKIANSDRLVIAGKSQPVEDAGHAVQVGELSSYDETIPAVLDIRIASSLPDPEGQVSDLQIGSGKQLLSGKKFVYTYDLDQTDPLGHARKQGDKDYVYSFSLGSGRELRVTYSIYAADNRDQSTTIDQLVRSIRKLK